MKSSIGVRFRLQREHCETQCISYLLLFNSSTTNLVAENSTHYLPVSLRQESEHSLAESSASGSHKAAAKASAKW